VFQLLTLLPDAACAQFDPNVLWRSVGKGWARAASLWSPGGAAPQVESTVLARQPTIRWTRSEELILLAEMEASGIEYDEDVEVPKFSTFMPFAATVTHLLGKRTQSGIAQKVRTLQLDGPGATKLRDSLKWNDSEERTLLAAMEVAGIAREEGAEVPTWTTFTPFAETVTGLLGKRSHAGVAQKVRRLLLDVPGADEQEEGSEESLSESELPDARSPRVRWTVPEEKILLDEMDAAGIARGEGVEVPGYSTFMPFAASMMHLLGEHRRQIGIASKVRVFFFFFINLKPLNK